MRVRIAWALSVGLVVAAAVVAFDTWPSPSVEETSEVSGQIERTGPCASPTIECALVEVALTSGSSAGQLVALEHRHDATSLGTEALRVGTIVRIRSTDDGGYSLIASERSASVALLAAAGFVLLMILGGRTGAPAMLALAIISLAAVVYAAPALDAGSAPVRVFGATIVLAAALLAVATDRRPTSILSLTAAAAMAALAASWLLEQVNLSDDKHLLSLSAVVVGLGAVAFRRRPVDQRTTTAGFVFVGLGLPLLATATTNGGGGAGLDSPQLAALLVLVGALGIALSTHALIDSALTTALRFERAQIAPLGATPGNVLTGETSIDDLVIDLRPAIRRELIVEDDEPVVAQEERASLLTKLRAGLED